MKAKAKKVIALTLAASAVCPLCAYTPVSAAATASQLAVSQVSTDYRTDNVSDGVGFKVYLNGSDVTSSFSNPIQVTTEGRTLLPLRDLGNILGCTIDWDADNKVAIVTKGSTTIEVPIGSTNFIVNGSSTKIDSEGTQAIILDSRTYLPFRAIAEACGATVDYQVDSSGSKNIYLTTDGSTTPTTPPTEPGDVTEYPLKTATQLGYDSTHGPNPGETYYDSWNRTVTMFRNVGLTDEQIDNNLQYIYLNPYPDGEREGAATIEQQEWYGYVCDNVRLTGEPNYAGDFIGQIANNGYMWSGSDWTKCSEEIAGLAGLGLMLY